MTKLSVGIVIGFEIFGSSKFVAKLAPRDCWNGSLFQKYYTSLGIDI